MLRRILEWLVGRKEPVFDEAEKERRLRVLNQKLAARTGGKR